MVQSQITGKKYQETECVYIANMVQCQKYLAYLGPSYLLDILYAGTKRKDSLVFVFRKCEETKRAKELWDERKIQKKGMTIF